MCMNFRTSRYAIYSWFCALLYPFYRFMPRYCCLCFCTVCVYSCCECYSRYDAHLILYHHASSVDVYRFCTGLLKICYSIKLFNVFMFKYLFIFIVMQFLYYYVRARMIIIYVFLDSLTAASWYNHSSCSHMN